MNLTIQKFSIIMVFTLVSILLSVFFYSYTTQRNKTATVIINSLHSNISETSYLLSKRISSKDKVKNTRPFLDRITAHNDFIAAILIHDGNTILLSTDPHYGKILPSHHLKQNAHEPFKHISNAISIEHDISFYNSNKHVTLYLQYILDKEEVANYFSKRESFFVFYFILLPFIIVLLSWMIIKYFVIRPLETLRQFAYYQNNIPKAFLLRELETIRYSMVQTFERLESEKKELYHNTRTDSLSGLANRNSLDEYLQRLILDAKRNKKEFAFLFLDLDHFKSINDSLGHNVGDDLLKKISSRVSAMLRPNDFIARVGGDEFIIILQEYNSIVDLSNVTQRILKQLSQIWVIQTNPITITASVGIALYPKDGEDLVTLMKHSDIAMYEAKKTGRAKYHFFTAELNDSVQETIQLTKDIKDALLNKEYELYYQPKVATNSSKIIGVEALIRWISPTKGIIPPDLFIPICEENNFILELGDWILEDAIKQQAKFKKENINVIMSINISSKQILAPNFVKTLTNLLYVYDVSPEEIDLEITEYMFLQQTDKNKNILNELHILGVSISLDDFGTGYSSLSYLKDFHIDYLKIDKSFLDDYNTKKGAIFLETIVTMGQTLGIKIIAEGVEEFEQLQYIQDIGCDQYQGYFFSKPLTSSEFEKLYFKSIST